jgi:predicted ATP-grasp superfamily ATP-dependent carboligase
MNLSQKLIQSNYDFYFLVVDEFLDIKLPEITNLYSLTPAQFQIDIIKNSGVFLSQQKVINHIKNNSLRSGNQPAIIPFKPSAKIDKICQQNNWLLVANKSHINRLLEDKIKFSRICDDFCIPTIPHLVFELTPENFQKAINQFGNSLVVQTHFGWAGNSTFFTKSWGDIIGKVPAGIIVKISPFLEGYSLLNNCCVYQHVNIQSPTALQYTGFKKLTLNPFATVGRQWPSNAPITVLDQVNSITEQFYKILVKYDYRGFYGLDFFVSNEQVYLLECNPRLTASFAFYTQIELQQALTPLFYYHLAEFADIRSDTSEDYLSLRRTNSNLIGSEITLKSTSGATIKKYNDFIPFVSSPNATSIPGEILSKIL